jgi:integrase
MPATIIRKRLQIQPAGRTGIDRSVAFVVGDASAEERRKLRGAVFTVVDQLDASRRFGDLYAMAKEAVAKGEVPGFLDALDRREGNPTTTETTFEAFSEEWTKTCVDNSDLRESQVESDKSILKNHLVPYFGRFALRHVDVRMVDRYKAEKRAQKHQYGEGYSPHTINNHLSVVHRIFEKAIAYGLAEKNPVTKSAWMSRDTTTEESRAWLTPEEETKVVAVLRSTWKVTEPERYMPVLTQLVVGMRFGELRALEKADLDFTAPGIWVRRSKARKTVTTPKNKKARFHAIPRELAEELKVWMLRTEGQLLFPGARGKHLQNNTMNRWYRELCALAGVPPISSHGARHTSGSSYAMLGASQKMIASLLGHTDTSATEKYTHMQVSATAPIVEQRWRALAGE